MQYKNEDNALYWQCDYLGWKICTLYGGGKDRLSKDREIGKGRRHCWTQCKFMGPFFDIAAFRSTFGARIFHERYIYLQYKDTEQISKPDLYAGLQY